MEHSDAMSAPATTRTAAWAPLRHPAFRIAWLTFLGVQLVNWSETVGAVEVIAAQSPLATKLEAGQFAVGKHCCDCALA